MNSSRNLAEIVGTTDRTMQILKLEETVLYGDTPDMIKYIIDRTNRLSGEIVSLGFIPVPGIIPVIDYSETAILQGRIILEDAGKVEAAHLLAAKWIEALVIELDKEINRLARIPMTPELEEADLLKSHLWIGKNVAKLTAYDISMVLDHGLEHNSHHQLVGVLIARWKKMFPRILQLMWQVVEAYYSIDIKSIDEVLAMKNYPNLQEFKNLLGRYFQENLALTKARAAEIGIDLGTTSYWEAVRLGYIAEKQRQIQKRPLSVMETLQLNPGFFANVLWQIKEENFVIDDVPRLGHHNRASVCRGFYGPNRTFKAYMSHRYDAQAVNYEETSEHESRHLVFYAILEEAIRKGYDPIKVLFYGGSSILSEAVAMSADVLRAQKLITRLRQIPFQLSAFYFFDELFNLKKANGSLEEIALEDWMQFYKGFYDSNLLPLVEKKDEHWRFLVDVGLNVVDGGLYILAALINSELAKIFPGKDGKIDDNGLIRLLPKVIECQTPFHLICEAKRIAEIPVAAI